jgi:hypothetical protein
MSRGQEGKIEFGIGKILVGAGPCACPDFGQTPREIAKGEWRKAKKQIAKGGRRIAKMRNGDPSFRNPQFAFRNPPLGAGLV